MGQIRFTWFILSVAFMIIPVSAGEPKTSPPTKLQKKMRAYEKYLRSAQVKTPGSQKTMARAQTRKIRVRTKPKPSLKILHEITQSYYQNLYSKYEDAVRTFRFFLEFLKTGDSISLKELKVRIQQLQSFLSRGNESLIQIRRRLTKLSSALKTLSKDGNQIAIAHINTPHYSQLLNFQSHLDLERETIEYLVEKIATLEIYHWGEYHRRLEEVVSEIESLHTSTWKNSQVSPRLREQPELVRSIKEHLQLTGKDLKVIRNHFIYTESVILKKFSQLEPLHFPSHSSNPVSHRSFLRAFEKLEAKLRFQLEQEKLEIALLEAQLKNQKTVKDPTLQILPLSQHLFFNSTI